MEMPLRQKQSSLAYWKLFANYWNANQAVFWNSVDV